MLRLLASEFLHLLSTWCCQFAEVISCGHFIFDLVDMLLERECSIKCDTKIDWVWVVFQFFIFPFDLQILVCLVVVKME